MKTGEISRTILTKNCAVCGLLGFTLVATAEDVVLSTDQAEVVLDSRTGAIEELRHLGSGLAMLTGVSDRYEREDEKEKIEANEESDRVDEVVRLNQGVLFRCTNPKLPKIRIEKEYGFDKTGSTLIKDCHFVSAAESGFSLMQYTRVALDRQVRPGGLFIRPQRQAGYVVDATSVTEERRMVSDERTGVHRVIFANARLGVGLAHFRYLIDGRFVVPTEGRTWGPSLAHYTPEGWRFGIFATYLNPGETSSNQVRFDLFDGDPLEHYLSYRHLPEVEALFDIDPPEWVRHLDAIHGPFDEPQKPGESTEEYYIRVYEEMDRMGLSAAHLGVIMHPHYFDYFSTGTPDQLFGEEHVGRGFGSAVRALPEVQEDLPPAWAGLLYTTGPPLRGLTELQEASGIRRLG